MLMNILLLFQGMLTAEGNVTRAFHWGDGDLRDGSNIRDLTDADMHMHQNVTYDDYAVENVEGAWTRGADDHHGRDAEQEQMYVPSELSSRTGLVAPDPTCSRGTPPPPRRVSSTVGRTNVGVQLAPFREPPSRKGLWHWEAAPIVRSPAGDGDGVWFYPRFIDGLCFLEGDFDGCQGGPVIEGRCDWKALQGRVPPCVHGTESYEDGLQEDDDDADQQKGTQTYGRCGWKAEQEQMYVPFELSFRTGLVVPDPTCSRGTPPPPRRASSTVGRTNVGVQLAPIRESPSREGLWHWEAAPIVRSPAGDGGGVRFYPRCADDLYFLEGDFDGCQGGPGIEGKCDWKALQGRRPPHVHGTESYGGGPQENDDDADQQKGTQTYGRCGWKAEQEQMYVPSELSLQTGLVAPDPTCSRRTPPPPRRASSTVGRTNVGVQLAPVCEPPSREGLWYWEAAPIVRSPASDGDGVWFYPRCADGLYFHEGDSYARQNGTVTEDKCEWNVPQGQALAQVHGTETDEIEPQENGGGHDQHKGAQTYGRRGWKAVQGQRHVFSELAARMSLEEGRRDHGKRIMGPAGWGALLAATIATALCKHLCGCGRRARARDRWRPGSPCISDLAVKAIRTGRGQPRRFDPRARRIARHSRSVRRARASGSAPRNHHKLRPEGEMRGHTPQCPCCSGGGGCTSSPAVGQLSGDDPHPRAPSRRRTKPSGISSAPRLAVKFGILKTILIFVALAGRAWAATSEAPSRPLELGSIKRSWNMLTSRSRDGLGSPIHAGCAQTPQDARDGRQALGGGADRERGTTVIISGNIHALGPRVGEISNWEADVLLLQETKLAAHAIKDASAVARDAGWTLIHGRPCSPGTRTTHRDGPRVPTKMTEANSGGVAAMVRKPRRDLALEFTQDEAALHATGRWTKVCTTIGQGRGILTTATIYGISGANSSPKAMKHNEILLSQAISLLIKAGDQPYIIMGDINVEPEASPAVSAAVDSGLLVDVGHLFASKTGIDEQGLAVKCPEPTFDKKGPMPGMEGTGVSRIDVALANPAAVSAIKSFDLRWDLVQVDHVPIQITLNVGDLDEPDVVQRTRGDVNTDGAPQPDDDRWDAAYQRAFGMYGHDLQGALDGEDVDAAHKAWCYFAESCIQIARGKCEDEVRRELENSPARGASPQFYKRPRRKPTDHLGHPTTYVQRQLTNATNRLLEVRNRLKKRESEQEGSAWEAVTDPEELALMVKLWTDAIGRAKGTLGTSKVNDMVKQELPTCGEIQDVVNALRAEHERLGVQARLRRNGIRKAERKWDWEKNHGRKAFQSTRVGYVPPTFALRSENDVGGYVTSPADIHERFKEYWDTVFSMHKEGGQERWDEFYARFGPYIPYNDYVDKPYTGADYAEQLRRMSESSSGFDGWTLPALRLLPMGLWTWRAKIDNLAKRLGTVPRAYLHVPSPMLPKGHALLPCDHRGIVIFSMLHRVTYGIEWARLREWQEGWITDAQHGGRVGGEFMADAWDLQSRIEAAMAEGQPLVGALLDYSKFFDRFCPHIVRGLFLKAGAPEGLAGQLFTIISNMRRYIKVAGTYGAVLDQSNGAGQGCSMSIIAANLYVATLINFLNAEFPEAEVAAFLDDRNVIASTVSDLKRIIEATKTFDDIAGHETNVEKTAVFATTATDRKTLRGTSVHGQHLKVRLNETMVGHDITTRRARRTTFLSSRTEKATLRAEKVCASNYTRRQRTRLIQQAVIPAAVSGTLWDIPSLKKVDGLRSSVTNAVWGKGRKQRSREIVLAIINDATRTDPLAAVVYRRLDDARRLMRKNPQRYMYARHLHDITYDETTHGEVFHKGANGPMRGLRQAAALLGGRLELDDDGFFVSFGGAQPPLRMSGGTDRAWKSQLKRTITNAITRQLSARLIDPEGMDDEDKRGKRKDLFGIGAAIDVHATTINISGKAIAVSKKFGDLWEECGIGTDHGRFHKDDICNQRMQAIIAGSIRAPDRLFKAGLVASPRCPFCHCERADTKHMLWQCRAWEAMRAPYLDLLRAYKNKIVHEHGGQRRVQELDRILALPCVINCGVIPESEYFKCGGPPIPGPRPSFLRSNSPIEDLTPREQDALQRDGSGRVVAFTDGSAIHPTEERRRRAAWGVFYAPDHPWNGEGPVHGDAQTVYAAELMAAVHVLRSATTPTTIVSDCRSVVDLIRDELGGHRGPIRGDYEDMRKELRRAIAERPQDFFDVHWVPSHLDLELAGQVEEMGGPSRDYLHGNANADLIAKSAMRWHNIDGIEYVMAEDREVVAAVVQAMQEAVWSRIFDADVNLRNLEDHALEHDACQLDGCDDGPQDDDDPDGDAVRCDPLRLSNSMLANFIKRVSPGYAWLSPQEGAVYEEVTFPELPHYARVQRRASTLIAGRGMVNMSFPYPSYYAEAVRWWLNQLRWPIATTVAHLPPSSTTATNLECVIDFELATGLKIGADGTCSTAWTNKAKVLMNMIKAVARIFTIRIGGRQVTLQEAIDPRVNAPSLVPLGAPPMAGLGRRPLWASSRTTSAVAVNVWRAREDDKRRRASAGSRAAATDRTRAFAKTWEVNYANFPTEDRWNPSAVADLKRKLDVINQTNEERSKRPRLQDLQPHRRDPPPAARAPLVCPQPPPDDPRDAVVALPRDLDSGLPLPAMTREFKRARLNLPPTQEAGSGALPFVTPNTSASDTHSDNRNSLDMNSVHLHGANGEAPCARHSTLHGGSSSSSASRSGASSAAVTDLCPAPGGATRRARPASKGIEAVPCAACGVDTPIFGSRFLPNAPWTSQAWRGARPGTMICLKCHGEYVAGT